MNQWGIAACVAALLALYHNALLPSPAARAAPQLELKYFSGPGRAELSRLVLSFGDVNFSDTRLDRDAFAALKPSLPLGQVPVLTVDGVTYSQSMAIARYAAKLAGLYPSDPLECLRVDMISESLVDVRTANSEIMYKAKTLEDKAEKTQKLLGGLVPRTLQLLESFVEGEFFLGDGRPSYADLQLYDTVTNALAPNLPGFSMDGYPKLSKVIEAVAAVPNVAAYLEQHSK